MVQSYWEIGRLIVEHEQQGSSRAEYGKQQLQQLSQQLTERLGKGFDVRNLRNMRQFLSKLSKTERSAYRIELDSLSHPAANRQCPSPRRGICTKRSTKAAEQMHRWD
ncbi:MAG: DUF1016 N-terminal domain-containing protein [Vreelandella alkaliphila]|uniref:DUF1016 N-terminal domain-containing protein n=1 Tax=Gammaproteobacteria TaxID=1236 RepID=UPI001D01E111|nr:MULTISPECIES: DUF1016 N-terminal domain-containing protein [unclassified Halomonas]WKD28315.1 DUF1016 N-terminal domain-containing protein [Halomonas sp. KG2]